MQFLQGKMIQHEFCHLLNMLLDSAKQVVVAADRAPWELESLDPRVRSRLQGGVAIEVEAPDYEMRLEILKRRLDAARQDDPSLEIPAELLSQVIPSKSRFPPRTNDAAQVRDFSPQSVTVKQRGFG